jgi:uncharacterized protein DUF1161
MKSLVLAACVCLVAMPAIAQTKKPCDELKAEIEKKLEANGVKNYTLMVVEADKVKDEKVVGSCDGGTKKITYALK